MSQEEQDEALASGERVMKFSFLIDGTAYKYSYEFYRCGDRRVLVRLYKENIDGETVSTPLTDFYVSTFAFKKIVGNFLTVLNGETVDLNKVYY